MSIPYKPLTTRIVLQQNKKVEKTPGGIIIPDTVASDVKTAIVMAIGEDVTSLKEGDKVSYSVEPTRGITVDGKPYFIMYETEIDGIFRK